MKILVYGLHYLPDEIGIPKYTGEMSEWLATQGHEVEVITAKPFYPEWKLKDGYTHKKWFTEEKNGVTVYRSPIYVPSKPSASKKIIHEASFVLSSMKYWFKKLFSKPDVIIGICPPFHSAVPALIFSKLRRVPFIFHVQDLQIDIAKDLGMIQNNILLSFLFFIEKMIMKTSSYVSTISDGMHQRILEKGVKEKKMMRLPNWVDGNHIKPLSKENSLRETLGFSLEDKIVLYSGNLGEKQGLDKVIEIANELQQYENLHFVIVGNGAGKEILINLANKYQLQNVKFFPLQPYEKLSELLAMADIHLVLQKKEAADLVMPSKLTSILAAGGCAIVTADEGCTLYNVVKEHNMGIIVPTDDAQALKKAIEDNINQDTAGIQKNARLYAQANLEKDEILGKFENQLKDIVLQS